MKNHQGRMVHYVKRHEDRLIGIIDRRAERRRSHGDNNPNNNVTRTASTDGARTWTF